MNEIMLVGLPIRLEKKVQKYFQSVRINCDKVKSIEEAIDVLPDSTPLLMVVHQQPSVQYLDNLNSVLKKKAPHTPFLVTMERGRLEEAIEAMNAGAYDCLEPGFNKLSLLAAAKRATHKKGRNIVIPKIVMPKRRTLHLMATVACGFLLMILFNRHLNGPPLTSLNLDSNYLSGIQWEERTLWVGDWFNSTVTKFKTKKGLTRKSRKLVTQSLFRLKDGQPILVCNTPEALVTIGNDLNMRTHRWDVGLPTLQTVNSPANHPTGLTWDGAHLWSTDAQTGLLYRHDRFLRVIETERSLIPHPKALSWGENSLWVMGGEPLVLAQMERRDQGIVWHGPYPLVDWIPEGKNPTGIANAFGQLWVILEGSSVLLSKDLKELKELKTRWKIREPLQEVG